MNEEADCQLQVKCHLNLKLKMKIEIAAKVDKLAAANSEMENLRQCLQFYRAVTLVLTIFLLSYFSLTIWLNNTEDIHREVRVSEDRDTKTHDTKVRLPLGVEPWLGVVTNRDAKICLVALPEPELNSSRRNGETISTYCQLVFHKGYDVETTCIRKEIATVYFPKE